MSMTAIGATALAGGLGAAATLGAAGISAAANQGLTKKAREENFMYNERAANNALQRQYEYQNYLQKLQYRQYYDLESPKAIIEQLKEAGLSPSIFAAGALGNSISGVTTGASAPQGAGASGLGAPQVYFSPLDMSQVAVNMASARRMNAEADTLLGNTTRGQAEIGKILSETARNWAEKGYKQAAQQLVEAQTVQQELQNYVTSETAEFDISRAISLAEREKHQAIEAGYKAEREGWALKFDEATFETRVQEESERVTNLIADTALKESQTELNEAEKTLVKAQTKQVLESIKQEWSKIDVSKRNWTTYTMLVKKQCSKMNKDIEAIDKELALKGKKINLDFTASCIGSAAHIVGCAMP